MLIRVCLSHELGLSLKKMGLTLTFNFVANYNQDLTEDFLRVSNMDTYGSRNLEKKQNKITKLFKKDS